jgi:hypothetical protein
LPPHPRPKEALKAPGSVGAASSEQRHRHWPPAGSLQMVSPRPLITGLLHTFSLLLFLLPAPTHPFPVRPTHQRPQPAARSTQAGRSCF